MTNPALLTIARHYGRADLYANVRDNLTGSLYVTEPNGELESVHSRRQDQTALRYMPEFLLQYRELAIRYGDGRFAAVAALLRERGAGQTFGETPLGDRLAEVLDRPELARPLPEVTSFPTDFEHHDESCRLVRVRRGERTATIFSGTDLPELHAISSGLSTNPTFFKMRKGAAILDSLRLSPQFFSLGHFRSESLERDGDGWRLRADVRAAFHQPLPRRHRRRDGLYPLTNDGRFWSSMDFPHRPKEYRGLRTEILLRETADGGWDLSFEVSGSEVPLALELCFRRGGRLTGDGLEPVSRRHGHVPTGRRRSHLHRRRRPDRVRPRQRQGRQTAPGRRPRRALHVARRLAHSGRHPRAHHGPLAADVPAQPSLTVRQV